MKVKNTLRIPIGFAAGVIFIIRANPTFRSFCVGTVIMLFGEAIRFISAGTLIKFEGVTCKGIYAYSRNPLYLGSFFIGLGACITGRDILFSTFFIIAYPILYLRIIKREEHYLTGRYGDDYDRYKEKVSRFWSDGFNVGEILRESTPFLAVKNRELRTVIGVVIVLTVMALKMMF